MGLIFTKVSRSLNRRRKRRKNASKAPFVSQQFRSIRQSLTSLSISGLQKTAIRLAMLALIFPGWPFAPDPASNAKDGSSLSPARSFDTHLIGTHTPTKPRLFKMHADFRVQSTFSFLRPFTSLQ